METNIDDIGYGNFMFEQKKKFFSQFIEFNDVKSAKNKTNFIKNYFDQLILISKDIKMHFKNMIQVIDGFIEFFKDLEIMLKK
jgi:hypothetical protein